MARKTTIVIGQKRHQSITRRSISKNLGIQKNYTMYTFEKKLFFLFLVFYTSLFHCRRHCHTHTSAADLWDQYSLSPIYIISFRFNRHSTLMTFATPQWYTLTVFGKPWLFIFYVFIFTHHWIIYVIIVHTTFFHSFLSFFSNRIMVFIAFYWRPGVARSKSA